MATYQLNINGQRKEVTTDASTPLLWVLRDDLKMTGTKYGCVISVCGACTVHAAGVADRSATRGNDRGDRARSRGSRSSGCVGVRGCRSVRILSEWPDYECC